MIGNAKLLLGTVLLAGTVAAQPAPPAGGEVDLSVKQQPTLSAQEMLAQAREYLKTMGQALTRIQVLQESAKRQKDIIKLNCVTDKLVQAKVNTNIADQALTTLQESIARADEGGRTHEFTRLTIVNQKVLVLGAEAENCIGEDLSFVGATRVEVEIDPRLPAFDPTQPANPTLPVERPPEITNLPDRQEPASPMT